jgi:hypothetical protein
MIRYLFFLLIAIGAVFSFTGWRRGLYLMIVAAVLQDPIRKASPDAPAYLVLASVPIWMMMIAGAYLNDRHRFLTEFQHYYPRLLRAFRFFAFMLVPATVISLTHGRGAWQITLIGLFAYASPILGVMLGLSFARNPRDIERLMSFFCIITAVVLIGALLEQLGLFRDWPILGTGAMKFKWLRFRTGYTIQMIAGFYRSPDVMGWHAVTLVLLAATLALYCSGAKRYLWALASGWGLLGVFLCGRRKFSMMVPIYVAVLLWVYWKQRRGVRVGPLVMLLVIVGGIGAFFYVKARVSDDVLTYYVKDTGDVLGRVFSTSYDAVRESLASPYGLFGAGVGTAAQGTQHVEAVRPRMWQEGGLSKVAGEVGVLGFVAFTVVAWRMFQTIRQNLRGLVLKGPGVLFAGLAGLFFGNAASFVVSGQIFGDPFINCFFALLTGLFMSRIRLEAAGVPQAPEFVPARSRRYFRPRVIRPPVRAPGPFPYPEPGYAPYPQGPP